MKVGVLCSRVVWSSVAHVCLMLCSVSSCSSAGVSNSGNGCSARLAEPRFGGGGGTAASVMAAALGGVEAENAARFTDS